MRMRLIISGIVVACSVAVCSTPAVAQTGERGKQFEGIKLVDPQNQRGLETDVSVRVDSDQLVLIEPVSKKEVRKLPYSSITTIDETLSSAPPLPAGVLNRESVGSASMPAYMGKEPRRWWTLNNDGAPVILRVSSKVYKQLKAAVSEHNVKIQDAPKAKAK